MPRTIKSTLATLSLMAMGCTVPPSDPKAAAATATGGAARERVDTGGGSLGTGGAQVINVGGPGGHGDSGGGAGGVEVNNKKVTPNAYGLVPLSQVTDGGIEDLVDECAGDADEVEQNPVVLQLVVDVSSSMSYDAPNTAGVAKWEITKQALSTALNTLPYDAAVGVTFYPNTDAQVNLTTLMDPSFCVDVKDNVPIARLGAPGSQERLLISRAFQAIEIPPASWGTPTYDGYSLALQSLNGSAIQVSPDQKFMLLITDGMPTFDQNCLGRGVEESYRDTEPLLKRILQQISAARAQGIRTFVIGSPGSEKSVSDGNNLRPWLSDAAIAGGTATIRPGCSSSGPDYCHFDMSTEPDFGQGLSAALELIASTLACQYTVPEPDSGQQLDTGQAAIVFTEDPSTQTLSLMLETADPSCPAGWRYSNDTKTEIQICGKTCDYIKSFPQGRLDLVFGCRIELGPVT
jgi:hypothetical protein